MIFDFKFLYVDSHDENLYVFFKMTHPVKIAIFLQVDSSHKFFYNVDSSHTFFISYKINSHHEDC